MFSDLGKALVQELEAPQVLTGPGTGWISGVLGLFLAMAGLAAVICLRCYAAFSPLAPWRGERSHRCEFFNSFPNI